MPPVVVVGAGLAGLTVALAESRRVPVVAHYLFYKAGGGEDPHLRSGIAHFLEHLMFKGTSTLAPGEFSRVVARNGGRDNAFTSWDYTGYFQQIHRDRLAEVMALEADRMTLIAESTELMKIFAAIMRKSL